MIYIFQAFYRRKANQQKWDRRFLSICRTVSGWSKDPRQGVGAVIVGPNRQIVSTGYNGLPRKIKDRGWILNNRDAKLRHTIHAEENSILLAQRDVTGMTLYCYPIPPCIKCACMIIQTGIARVVTVENENDNPKWLEEGWQAIKLFKEAGIDVVVYKKSFLNEAPLVETEDERRFF